VGQGKGLWVFGKREMFQSVKNTAGGDQVL
jgi:hypothetical protein